MMRFEIVKAENGYVVHPLTDPDYEEVYVFNDWTAASLWLREQFEPKEPQ